jgi:hypothetical protein
MRKITVRVFVLAGTAVLAACANAPSGPTAVQRKPGLWEVTTQLHFVQGEPPMSPDQLEKAKQPLTTKVCVTPEQAARRDSPIYSSVAGCQLQNTKYADDTFKGDLSCDRPEMHGAGSVEAVFSSNESYSGSFHFTGTSQQLGTVEMNNRFSGRWLGTDCGDVKPIAQAP